MRREARRGRRLTAPFLATISMILEVWNMDERALQHLPVAVIGGGPVGLAAAAHLIARGLSVKVYEAGSAVGSNLRDWGHVRVFTPWRYCVDVAATVLLARRGWRMPDADAFPTGGDLVSAYLEPLAATPELTAVIETNARVTAISRRGLDEVVSPGREARPFVLIVKAGDSVRRDLARAVVDASGTWATPNPTRGERSAGGGRSRVLGSDRLWHSGYSRPRSSSLCRAKDACGRVGAFGCQRSARTRPAQQRRRLAFVGDPQRRPRANL